MPRSDSLLVEVTRKLLREIADPQHRRSQGADRRAIAWRAIEAQGLTRAWLPEAAGGAGAGIADGFAILTLAGQVALDVPLAETLLAGWLLATAGLDVPGGALAIAGGDDRIERGRTGQLSGRLTGVAFAREAAGIAVAGDGFVALVDPAACAIEPRDNLAGEPRDTVILDDTTPIAVGDAPAGLRDRLTAMGAVARSCQMAGALDAVLARSVAYAGERVAFDRPIGKFQAVQQALARLAGETAVALAASGSAADALADPSDPDGVVLEVASAKIRVGEAAAAGAAIAHQVHGAIGFSTEHPLHLFTQRLWAWRDDFGGEARWAARLGSFVAARGADALWPLIASR